MKSTVRTPRQNGSHSTPEPTRDHDEGEDGSRSSGSDDQAQDGVLDDLDVLESFGDDVTWYLYRLGGDKTRPSDPDAPAYVMRFQGAFDLERVRLELGGGRFLVIAKRRGEPPLRRRISIEGDPRTRPLPPLENPAPAGPPAPAPWSAELAEMRAEIRQLLTRPVAPAAEALTFDSAMRLFDRLLEKRETVERVNPIASARHVLDIAAQMAGQQSDSIVGVLREHLPRAMDLIGEMMHVGKPRAAAAPNDDAPAAATPNVLVEALVRAMTFHKTPAIAADSLEELMSEDELTKVRGATPEMFLAWIKPYAPQYPVLKQDDAQEWLKAWHREMQTPAESNGTTG